MPDLLLLLAIPCLVGVEHSRKITILNFDDDKSLYQYVLVYLIIFFAFKLIIIFAETYFYLTTPSATNLAKPVPTSHNLSNMTASNISQISKQNNMSPSP